MKKRFLIHSIFLGSISFWALQIEAQTAKQKILCENLKSATLLKASLGDLTEDLKALKLWAGDIGLSEAEASCEAKKKEALEQKLKDSGSASTVDAKWERAEALQFLGRTAEAWALYNDVVSAQPQRLMAHQRVAQMAADRKDPTLERKHLRIILGLNPKPGQEWEAWLESLEKLLPTLAPKDVLPFVERAASRSTSPDRWALKWAESALAAKDLESLKKAQGQLKGPSSLLYRAEVLFLEERFPEAARNFWQYLRTEGRDPSRQRPVQGRLLKIFEDSRDWPRVRRIAEDILRTDPNDVMALNLQEKALLKGALSTKGRLADLERAIELNPKSAALQVLKVSVLLGGTLRPERRGSVDEDRLLQADAHVEVMLSQDRKSVEANYWKAATLFHRSSFTAADRFFTQAIESYRSGLRPVTIDVIDLWVGAALNKKSRGYFAEGRELLVEALTMTQDKDRKEELRKLLAAWGRDT